MFRVIRMQNDGNLRVQLFNDYHQAYHACVPANMTAWHMKMYVPVMQALNIIGAPPVLVSYNENQNLLVAYWIEVITDEHIMFPALVMPNNNYLNQNNNYDQVD